MAAINELRRDLRLLTDSQLRARNQQGSLPRGKLIEISGDNCSARTTTAVLAVVEAQQSRETTVWIQYERGALYPPDLVNAGVDLEALTGRLRSCSYAPPPDHPNHLPLVTELRRLFATCQRGGQVSMDYDCRIYYGRLSPRPAAAP